MAAAISEEGQVTFAPLSIEEGEENGVKFTIDDMEEDDDIDNDEDDPNFDMPKRILKRRRNRRLRIALLTVVFAACAGYAVIYFSPSIPFLQSIVKNTNTDANTNTQTQQGEDNMEENLEFEQQDDLLDDMVYDDDLFQAIMEEEKNHKFDDDTPIENPAQKMRDFLNDEKHNPNKHLDKFNERGKDINYEMMMKSKQWYEQHKSTMTEEQKEKWKMRQKQLGKRFSGGGADIEPSKGKNPDKDPYKGKIKDPLKVKPNTSSAFFPGSNPETSEPETLEDENTVTPEPETPENENSESIETETPESSEVNSKENEFEGGIYKVIAAMDRDASSFTQGLTYADGVLYESAGLYRKSSVRRLDPNSGEILQQIKMDMRYFAEGMAYYGDKKLIQITWKEKTGFIYDATNLEVIQNFTYHTTRDEGWGITYDEPNNQFIVSDGSEYLHFWDRETLEQTHKVKVTHPSGKSVQELNELEFWNGLVLSNVWYQDYIYAIDPVTGKIVLDLDFTSLWPHEERSFKNDVFNGISVTDKEDELFITGKKWPKIYRIKMNMDKFKFR